MFGMPTYVISLKGRGDRRKGKPLPLGVPYSLGG